MVGEEGFLGPEEEDSVEAARLIRLGGLERGILYDGIQKTRLCITNGGVFAWKVLTGPRYEGRMNE